jgi:hypothetical protein
MAEAAYTNTHQLFDECSLALPMAGGAGQGETIFYALL